MQPPPAQEPEQVESMYISDVAQSAYIAAHGDNIPHSLKEAILGKHADQWWKAMQEEMDMLQKQGTWKLVDRLIDWRS